MKTGTFRPGLGAWLGAASLAAIVAASTPVVAQTTVKRFDIPAQSLSSAILDFARQSDTLVLVPPQITAGKRSRPLNGSMTIDDGINQLLKGTDLQAVPTAGGGYRIEQPRPMRIAYAETTAGLAVSQAVASSPAGGH